MAALLNFIQTYFSREIKLNFFHLSIRKSFCTGKNISPESLKYHLAFVSILWYKENIYVDKNSMYLVRFSEKKINYVSQLLRPDGSIKKWHERKTEHKLQENSYFQWLQLLSAIPEGWKFIIKGTHESTANLIIYYYHVIKGSRILTLDKYHLPKYMLS